jgi:hypothetical protein
MAEASKRVDPPNLIIQPYPPPSFFLNESPPHILPDDVPGACVSSAVARSRPAGPPPRMRPADGPRLLPRARVLLMARVSSPAPASY